MNDIPHSNGKDLDHEGTATMENIASKTSTLIVDAQSQKFTLKRRDFDPELPRNSWWLEVLPEGQETFDFSKDLRLMDAKQISAGVEAVGKWLAGGFSGNGGIVIVAPGETLMYEQGNNTFAYVFYNYANDFSVKINGEEVPVILDPKHIPAEGIARVYNDSGNLYVKSKERPFTAMDEDPWFYWYIRAARSLLSGHGVRVSVWEWFAPRAEALFAVASASDKAKANQDRINNNKQMRESGRNVQKDIATTEALSAITGVEPVVDDTDLLVPVTDGTSISLKAWPMGQPIYVTDKRGNSMIKPLRLFSGTLVERMGVARQIRKSYLLDLNRSLNQNS